MLPLWPRLNFFLSEKADSGRWQVEQEIRWWAESEESKNSVFPNLIPAFVSGFLSGGGIIFGK